MQHPGSGSGNGREWEMQSSRVMKEQWVHLPFLELKGTGDREDQIVQDFMLC